MGEIIATNKWSCVLDSFAYAIGVDPLELILEIGHNGEDLGYHTQELIECMLSRGLSVTDIHRNPITLNPETGIGKPIIFGIESELRFAMHLDGQIGVILGFNQNNQRHAISWKQNKIHDPNIGYTVPSYELLKTNCEGCLVGISPRSSFTPTNFLRISKTV